MPFKSLYFDYFGQISVLFNSSVVNFVKRRSAFFAVQERDSTLGVGQYIFFPACYARTARVVHI